MYQELDPYTGRWRSPAMHGTKSSRSPSWSPARTASRRAATRHRTSFTVSEISPQWACLWRSAISVRPAFCV